MAGMRSSEGDGQPRRTETPQVRRMAAADMTAVCRVIGAAFADNPSTLANVGGDTARAERVMRNAVRIAKFGRRWSHALVAERDGAIVGALNAALWPHCQMGAIEKIRTVPSMAAIMRDALPRAFTMTRRREAHDPREPHWHVGPLGVHPDIQGQGVGASLLQAFLSTADEAGEPTFLETDVERNVIFYQRFGFEVVDSEVIVGVNTRFMWRPALAHAHG
jgi:ribosomal protein S18 acetylase RimI-like enzyme